MVSLLTKTFLIWMLTTSHLNQAMQEAESDPTQELLDAMNSGTEDDGDRAIRAIHKGANINVRNEEKYGQTPLHFAVRIDHLPLAQLLVDMKADLTLTDKSRSTPLEYVVRVQSLHRLEFYGCPFIQLFLNNGAQLNGLLHEAACWGDIQRMETLLDNGVDVDTQDSNGCTPLHKDCNFYMAKLLLERGADWEIRNKKGERPSNMDHVSHYPGMLHLIRERRKEIQKQFLAPATIIIHATVVGQERGVAQIIAEYAVPNLEDCGMALKKSIDRVNKKI